MMKKIIAFIVVLCMLLPVAGCRDDVEGYKATLYFLSSTGNRIETEERIIENAKSESTLAMQMLSELIKGPSRPDLIRSVPEKATVLSLDVNNGQASVNFNENFKFDNEINRIFACTAVVSTLTALPGIERVKFMVNGEPLQSLDGKEVAILSYDDIVYDSQLVVADYRYVKLYFANEGANGLIPEGRTVTVNSKESLEYVLVNELIKGPEADYAYQTVPEGTKILSVETKEGTCFVNLSQEFKSKHPGGSAAENMTIYSVVNTLTELETVDKVQFLIEGQKMEVFIHSIFNEPFERNENIIV
ncbi:MAG: GerMN domain-containing protein [Clostridia bacterium]|nr:GerMN domain-containing protein [Clostridia bacterium]